MQLTMSQIRENFVFLLYFNWIFDLNSWNPNQSSWWNWLNRLRNASKFSNLIKSDQIYNKNGLNRSKSQKILTFLIKFDFFDLLINLFDHLINFEVVFFNLSIKNWPKSIDFNQKKIIKKIDWIRNQRYKIDIQFRIGQIL